MPLIIFYAQKWEKFQQQKVKEIKEWQEKKEQRYDEDNVASDFQKNYYKALEYKCRDDETQGLDNEFTLELQKIFVPLKIAANYSGNTKQDIIPQSQNQSSSETTIWDCLAAKDEKGRYIYKRLVVLGRPGSGKTTLLRHLTLIYATEPQQIIKRKTPKLIPVLFYLREIRKVIISQSQPLEELIKQQIENFKINNQNLTPPPNWVTNKLQENKFLIMLDGLDEVANKTQRQQVRNWIDNQMQGYPDTVFILTSRPNGYKEVQSKISANELEIQPFNREQITNFLQRWYLQTEIKSRGGQCDDGVKQAAEQQANNLIERIVNSRPLVAMAVNPLLLKMIATVHRRGNVLPGKRVELYKDICQILLEKRQRAKNISDRLTAKQKQSILQELALKLMQKEEREFTLPDAENWISGQLSTLPDLNKTEDFIKNIRDVCSLLVEKEIEEYEFAHLSFQEYLAAVEISESHQEYILIQNIDKTWWSETIRLYSAQAKNATNIIRAAINMSLPSINAFLVIADYEEEGWRIDQQVRDDLVRKLDAGLESDHKEIFKLAAEVKLARRLNNLVRIDENLEQDNSYITCAEYQLFINDSQYNPPQNWQDKRFIRGDAKKTLTEISRRDANRFCTWLTGKFLNAQLSQLETFYKPLKENDNIENNQLKLARVKLPSRYSQLANYLYKNEWRKADEETLRVMLQIVDKEKQGYLDVEDIKEFPCEDLYTINLLWVVYSQGHFGFSVQQEIYQSLGGAIKYNKQVWQKYGEHVGWSRGGDWLSYYEHTFTLKAYLGHLPAKYTLWMKRTASVVEIGEKVSYKKQLKVSYKKQLQLFFRAETCKL